MTTRTAFRFVNHTIRHAEEYGYSFEAACANYMCDWKVGPSDDQEEVQDECLRHAGRTGHDSYRRTVVDRAKVTREA